MGLAKEKKGTSLFKYMYKIEYYFTVKKNYVCSKNLLRLL